VACIAPVAATVVNVFFCTAFVEDTFLGTFFLVDFELFGRGNDVLLGIWQSEVAQLVAAWARHRRFLGVYFFRVI
jgi:hypothetical protein